LQTTQNYKNKAGATLLTKTKTIMKYTGVITGVLATTSVASLAILSTIHCTFGVAVIFAIMAIASAYLTYCEIKEMED
jgi:hypothetical protein